MIPEVCENFEEAVRTGNTDVVQSILKSCSEDSRDDMPNRPTKEELLNVPFTEVGTYLALATKLNHCYVVRALLLEGADPNAQNKKGLNSFYYAESKEMVQEYVDELFRAIDKCLLDRVESVLKAGVSVNCRDTSTEQNTPLHQAACHGDKAIVNCLIIAGADVNSTNAHGTTPLHKAVDQGDAEIVEELLKNKANPLKLDESAVPKLPFDVATTRSPHLLPLFQKYSPESLMSDWSRTFIKPEPLSLEGNISDNWNDWKQKFWDHVVALQHDNCLDHVKAAKLRNLMGDTGKQVLEALSLVRCNDPHQMVKKIDEWAASFKGVPQERLEFNGRIQLADEPFENFYQDVQCRILKCSYGTLMEELLRDKVVMGIQNSPLKIFFQLHSEIPLRTVVQMCRRSVSNTPVSAMVTNDNSDNSAKTTAKKRKGDGCQENSKKSCLV